MFMNFSPRILFCALFGAFIILSAVVTRPVHADDLDQLYLTGIIKSVNTATGLVYVEVRSLSCPGMKSFKVDAPEVLLRYIDQRVSFFIESNTCKDDSVHTMLLSRGLH
jgi:hypothetical protein